MTTSTRLLKVLSAAARRDLTLEQVQDVNLVETLPLSSIDALEVLIHIEGEFGVQIHDEDLSLDLVSSFAKLVAYIEHAAGGPDAASTPGAVEAGAASALTAAK
ncbi:acyl carrier protein [Roseateles amylovorans]|uniref:Acyl carrier protein n=1 Tax=Roseateles amylovorans TaxID=2978473 RepID=A0ABY6AWB6_9BURK|nr:acyl carrier protein [Roseateles amylovorans]UXH76101.1 acyl carrier protein [Roseateles amylovorans]